MGKQRIREGDAIPNDIELKWLEKLLGDLVCKRGAQLRRNWVRRYDAERERLLRVNPSKAFECVKPDKEPPPAALRRGDGSSTANICEMDQILRQKWSQIFCKYDEPHPALDVQTFLAQLGNHITPLLWSYQL